MTMKKGEMFLALLGIEKPPSLKCGKLVSQFNCCPFLVANGIFPVPVNARRSHVDAWPSSFSILLHFSKIKKIRGFLLQTKLKNGENPL